MNKEVDYLTIAQIPCKSIQFVSRFEIFCKPDTKIPRRFILHLACDKEKTGVLEFPVDVPIEMIDSGAHQQMLREFRDGAPIVAISCWKLRVFEKQVANHVEYYGLADDFELVWNAHEKIEEEIWR